LWKKGQELEKYDISDIVKTHLLTDVYCKYSELSFEECMDIKQAIVSETQWGICMDLCLEEISNSVLKVPAFEDMPPIKQNFETCLDEFGGPEEIFNTKIKPLPMLRLCYASFKRMVLWSFKISSLQILCQK
jgi:hypothetical protein